MVELDVAILRTSTGLYGGHELPKWFEDSRFARIGGQGRRLGQ